ncbi:MAG TPA: carbon-nitrogen hydrolase family protein [Candidatus Latescibacteria bacterium]|jgi:predicted amidohydrolase|nr:hypothetical protein [Gemmatimonadaceae bacterium]MDP6015188.1 carbon-nitrogen hydrolase family protein [Candidatus Latescibacterota bacterium]HJP33072.1 carbon-nitrogen hydrolase family protein [Candidatus Latescibacterota bacterium]
MARLRIATAQFPVGRGIERNLKYMVELTGEAKRKKGDVVHFSETCLGGYAGSEFRSWEGYDWKLLADAEQSLLQLSKKLRIGIVYGTNRKVSGTDVRNSLVYINAGKRVAHYDKRFCTGGDLKFYNSGKRFVTFELKGFKCGLLICYDVRFPELYREYKKRKTQVVFQSFYNARAKKANIHTTIMRPSLQTRAATNYLYISANNSSGYYQSWPSIFVLPDGTIAQSCRQHRTGLILNEIRSKAKFYDASGSNRDRAMAGVLYSE